MIDALTRKIFRFVKKLDKVDMSKKQEEIRKKKGQE